MRSNQKKIHNMFFVIIVTTKLTKSSQIVTLQTVTSFNIFFLIFVVPKLQIFNIFRNYTTVI